MYKKADSELDFMEVEESGYLKTALDALRQLMIEKLNSDKRTRFASVASLCEVAKSLMRAEASPRVPRDDIKRARFEEGDDGGVEFVGDITFNGVTQYQDPRQQKRNMDVQMSTLSQIHLEAQRSQLAAAEAQELKDLIALQDLTEFPERKGILKARVDKLFCNLEERNQDGDVVHSEFSRRSATGSSKSNGDLPSHVQPVKRGAEGYGILPEKSSEGRDDLQTMGNT